MTSSNFDIVVQTLNLTLMVSNALVYTWSLARKELFIMFCILVMKLFICLTFTEMTIHSKRREIHKNIQVIEADLKYCNMRKDELFLFCYQFTYLYYKTLMNL